MHGRPRKAPSEEEQKTSAAKAAKLRSLQSQFLNFHHNNIFTKEALDVSAKLVELNPEYYTAWNYRKLALQHRLSGESETGSDLESIKSILDEELRLVENALKRNFKSYGAWHHRKWVISKGHSSTDRELLLLGKFQKADSRNFHAWNYRRFITALRNTPEEDELQYIENMIDENFSNYSAWHNRSVSLSHLLKEKAEGYYPKENILTKEFEFVRNALFTDPDDQSGWFYHLWLLDQTVKQEHILVSSWPTHGSNLYVSNDGFQDCYALSQSLLSESGGLPLILYFSEPVEGINCSTVVVQCEYVDSNDFIWRPVQANKAGQANIWLTKLKFLKKELDPPKLYHIKVRIAESEGIISSSGICLRDSSQIAFTVCLPPSDSENGAFHVGRIYWGPENLYSYRTEAEKLFAVNSFCQLRISENGVRKDYDRNVKMIDDEIAYCRELLSEMDCKIGKLTLARLLMAHDALISYNCGNNQNTSHCKEVLELYHDLMTLDPTHFQYYKDQHSLVLLKQLASNGESLLKYCHQYKDVASPRASNYLCLRLSNLSISRLGSIEQLLWVQMLDLSQNELRSIEGLEAMQLLCCLNLSDNKIYNFSALEPVRQLKSLKVLDISYNEIGAHSIDTKRYSFASPLSHTVGSDWNSEELAISNVEMKNYWEAFSIFRGLSLTQLDVKGNPIADEKFKLFLCKLLPVIEWLDGEKVH